MRSNVAGAIARYPAFAYPSATARMCGLTPKISCSTTTAPFGAPDGSETWADDLKPSAALSVMEEEGMTEPSWLLGAATSRPLRVPDLYRSHGDLAGGTGSPRIDQA